MTNKISIIRHDAWLAGVASLGVFLFYAPMLSMPRGYNAGAVILLFAGLYHLTKRPFTALSGEDKLIMWLMAGVFAVAVFSCFYHDNPLSSLDFASRYLLTVPILLLLIRHPLRVQWLWAGLAVGACSAAGVALWDTVVLGLDRATGTTGGIQFGNLGLMLGVFCLASAAHAGRQREHAHARWWQALLVLGAIAGIYVSIASGSRGGWVAMPFIAVVFVVAYTARRSAKYVVASVVILVAAALVALATVPAVETRYDEAVSDIQLYQRGDPYTSLGQRLAMYEALAAIIPQKPWLGWSQAGFEQALKQGVQSGELSDAVLKLANSHNTFLEIWIYQGVLGVLALLALMGAALVYFVRRLRMPNAQVQAGAVCGATLIVAYAVFSLTQAMLARNNTVLFFLISMAVFWGLTKVDLARPVPGAHNSDR